MLRFALSGGHARRALALLLYSLALAGCDNEMTFSPVAPSFDPSSALGPLRSVDIIGSLTAEDGSCIEATILYDGRELPGARTVCSKASGCARLDLTGVVQSTTGRHTLSFQVLRQSSETVDYRAAATIVVSRDGLPMTASLTLEPARSALRAGEALTFDFEFQNSLTG
jgi:hypothetical protein